MEKLLSVYNKNEKKLAPAVYGELLNLLQTNNESSYSLEHIRKLIEIERYVYNNKKSHSSMIEGNILDFLSYFVIDYNDNVIDKGTILDKKAISSAKKKEQQDIHQKNLELFNFAKELLDLTIPRDNFSSIRKGKALNIICQLMIYYNIPDRYDFFLMGLKSKRNKLILETIIVLHNYFESGNQDNLPAAIITELDRLVLKSKERSIASGALNLQVVAGCISRLEALSRMDEWKEKYYY